MSVPVISVYEQTCHGRIQWRTMRDDGRSFLGLLQVDFHTYEDAIEAIEGEMRRTKTDADIVVWFIDWQSAGRRRISQNGRIRNGELQMDHRVVQ